MDFLIILGIAFALALDAFSVALAAGSYFIRTTKRQKFRLSFHFGLFQFMMPLIGWLAGNTVVEYISHYDHWIAFVLLAIVGSKMIETGVKNSDEIITKDITKGWNLVSLSVATSIDALAVGFSISMLKGRIMFPSLIIGIVAASMTLIGIYLGEKLSAKIGSKAALIGGIILILIGAQIVLSHLEII